MPDPRYQIDVSVVAQYLAERSQPERERFVFSYRVSIRNRGLQAARLLSRHWVITNGDGLVQEVSGKGVVGEQPLIEPGGQHAYDSWVVLATQVGSMQGSYQMEAEDGRHFHAEIAPFGLAVPGALH